MASKLHLPTGPVAPRSDGMHEVRTRKFRGSSFAATKDPHQRFREMLLLCERLINASMSFPISDGDEWLADAQTAAVKFGKHLISLRAIAGGETAHQYSGKILHLDHSSMKVIARAALETYWIFAFIFCSSPVELRHYRHSVWKLAGFLDRQKHPAQQPEHRKKQAEEASVIDELISEIRQLGPFLSLTEKQRKQVLKGDWRHPKGWQEVAVEAGFSLAYYERVYSYLCSYSHSSYLSVLQMSQARDTESQAQLGNTILDICTFTMARFVPSYCSLFSKARDVLSANPAHARLARSWDFSSQEFDRVWGAKS